MVKFSLPNVMPYQYSQKQAVVQPTPPKLPVSVGDIVNTEAFDFTQITSVRTVRPQEPPPRDENAPARNGDEDVFANISLNFLIDFFALKTLQRSVGDDATMLDIRLVNVAEESPRTIGAIAFNFARLSEYISGQDKASGMMPVSLNMEVNVADVQDPRSLLQGSRGVPGDVVQSLEFVFTILRAKGNESNQAGPPVAGATHSIPYDMDEDLNDYYIVRKPVNITAAATAIDQSLITVYKPANCNAESALIFRRAISLDGEFKDFVFVTEIDFSGESDTLIDENYTVSFVDGNPTRRPNSPLGSVDNSAFAYQYRAIPIGKRLSPSYVYRDALTTPVSQASVSIGDNFRVLPVFRRGANPRTSSDVTGYQIADDNFLSPNGKMINDKSKLSVVTYRPGSAQRGVTVSVTGKKSTQTPVAIDFLRRNITKSEKRFTICPTENSSPRENPQKLVPAGLDQGATFTLNFTDASVIDGQTYEYAVRSYSATGLTQLSDDTSITTYHDPRLLVEEGLELEVEDPVLINNNAVIDFTIQVPQNVVSLLEALLNKRIGSRDSPFAQDIINQRRNLSPQPAPVVRRLDRVTGEEVVFKLMGGTSNKFQQTNDNQEGVGIQSSYNFRFTDDTVGPGGQYQYEILVNLRDPLSVTDEVTSVVERSSQPYVFQACKIFNPLFTNKGILPPTPPSKDFILQKNINTGKDRLLNLLTAEDTWDLGRTSLSALVPSAFFSIPTSTTRVQNAQAKLSRVGSATVSWNLRGSSRNVDHFRVFSIDTYLGDQRDRLIKKSLVANIPAQGSQNFSVTSVLPALREEDRSQFLNQEGVTIDILDLQRLVDQHQVAVTRSYEIVVVNSKGFIESVETTGDVEIWSSDLRDLETTASRGLLEFVVPPSRIFEREDSRTGRRSSPGIREQAEEAVLASGFGRIASDFKANADRLGAFIAGPQAAQGRQVVSSPYALRADVMNARPAQSPRRNNQVNQNTPRFGENLPGMNTRKADNNRRPGNQVSPGELDRNNQAPQRFQVGNFRWKI